MTPTTITALDPGNTQTAWVKVEYPTLKVLDHGFQPNNEILGLLTAEGSDAMLNGETKPIVACEMVQSFGMPVGADVFETVLWIGRFEQKAFDLTLPFHRLFRKDIKLHLCGSTRAKDPNIRQALLDKLGPQGTKKSPGPTYGLSKHLWSALAVAITFIETVHVPQQPQLV